ncbi:hypothetical protein [Candidatus Poriferisocius sp.]|uniref:hypothetical protein n=1 Tax=Candidatus Poriferisocius sp. TaxID=3101276 RepID=UPI003B5C87C2
MNSSSEIAEGTASWSESASRWKYTPLDPTGLAVEGIIASSLEQRRDAYFCLQITAVYNQGENVAHLHHSTSSLAEQLLADAEFAGGWQMTAEDARAIGERMERSAPWDYEGRSTGQESTTLEGP